MCQHNKAVVLLSHNVDQDVDDRGISDYKPGIEDMDSLTRASKMLCNVIYHWPGYVDFQKDVAFLYNVDE